MINTFILNFFKKVLNCLEKITMFSIISLIISFLTRRKFDQQGDVEVWVLLNFALSVSFLLGYSIFNNQYLRIFFLVYAIWRVFGILVSVTKHRLLEVKINKNIYFYKRALILSFINVIEIIFWFSIFYQKFHYLFKSEYVCLNSFIGSIYFSVVTMTTLGYGDITPITDIAQIAIVIQSLIGIYFAIVIISSFISVISTSSNQK